MSEIEIKEIERIQDQAMRLADTAFLLERKGSLEAAKEKYYAAFLFLKVIADKVFNNDNAIVSRCSILDLTIKLAKSAGVPIEGQKYALQLIKVTKYEHIRCSALGFINDLK